MALNGCDTIPQIERDPCCFLFFSVERELTKLHHTGMAKRTTLGNAKLAIGYLRVSKAEMELGPEAQRAAIESWAKREGVRVVGWHLDQMSGGSDLADRPALGAALGALRAAGAGVLVVLRRDRLARDVAVAATIERAVESCGARVVTADGVANGDTPADAFLRTILDAAAAYERGLIRSRTKAALAAKRARGECAGEVPYGFRRDGARLEADEAECAVIARIREASARGVSQRGIVAELEAAGIVARSGRPMSKTQIARIIAKVA